MKSCDNSEFDLKHFFGIQNCRRWRFMLTIAYKHMAVPMEEKLDWKEIKIKIEAVKINLSCCLPLSPRFVCMRARSSIGWVNSQIPIQLATSSPQPPSSSPSSSFKHVWLGSFVYLAALAFIIIDHQHDELKPNDFQNRLQKYNEFSKILECASVALKMSVCVCVDVASTVKLTLLTTTMMKKKVALHIILVRLGCSSSEFKM